MAPKKLSDSDRKDILTRYRLPEETTVTIANHYGVSTSTISRILKQHLSEADYDALIQQKRSGGHRGQLESVESPVELPVELPIELPEIVAEVAPPVTLTRETLSPAPPKLVIKDKPHRVERSTIENATLDSVSSLDPAPGSPERPRRQRQRSNTYGLDREANEPAQLELDTLVDPLDYQPVDRELKEIQAEFGRVEPAKLPDPSTLVDEDLDDELDDDLDEDLDDDLDEDLDEDLDDDLDDDIDLAEGTSPFASVQITGSEQLRVLPLSEAQIPRTCYVVVDRSAELITRPLRDFAELGQIPEEEIQARTLPIFDNHRVAKRFMRRMQRVVKVPDGRVFQKVKPYLQAKGITRLLIDGRVYSL